MNFVFHVNFLSFFLGLFKFPDSQSGGYSYFNSALHLSRCRLTEGRVCRYVCCKSGKKNKECFKK